MEMLIQFPYKAAKENALAALEQLSSLLHILVANETIDNDKDLFPLFQLAQSLNQSAIQALEAQS